MYLPIDIVVFHTTRTMSPSECGGLMTTVDIVYRVPYIVIDIVLPISIRELDT